MCVTDLPGQATVGAAVGAVDAGRARAQRELRDTSMLTHAAHTSDTNHITITSFST